MKKKVLIICGQEIIYERNDGGKKGSYKNYELFQNVFGKQNVFLYIMTNKYFDNEEQIFRVRSYKNVLDRAFNIVRGSFFTSSRNEDIIIDFIEKNEIDIVCFERSMFGRMIKEIKRRGLKCEIWISVHNIEKNYFENKVKYHSKKFYLPYKMISYSEKQTFKYADYIIALTQRDASLIKEYYNKEANCILPMAFRDNYDRSKQELDVEESKELLFIGTMFPPNYDGIKWFVENVMVELDEYHLQIVGKNFELKRKELERKNVTVIGSVENLEKYYYRNNIIVMPIFYGDGIKVKTAEAMMYGKTILASDEALEGYDVKGIDGIVRCNSKTEYIEAIKMESTKRVYQYNQTVRELFLDKYSFEKQRSKCEKMWECIVKR